MATGANTTPLGRLNLNITAKKVTSSLPNVGSSLLKPSYMSSSDSNAMVGPNNIVAKRSNDDIDCQSTNWPPDGNDRKRKRRSRWGGDDKDKVFIPGMPTVLPSNLSTDQERAYLLQLQIEEISRRLRTGDLGIAPNPEDRSPSPEPIYNCEGKRLNTREYRTRKKLEDDRHYMIVEMMKLNTDYKPPADYKPPMIRVNEKVMIPQEEHPDINFVGLLIGPRGNTLKSMERETRAKIIIRGKGSVKEGKVASKDGQPLPGEDEPLHAFVTANNPESVKKAVEKIREIIRQGVEVPEGQNDLRRMQLRELALLNGTLRENDGPRCSNCGATNHRSWQCPDKPNITNNVICTNCGGVGHIARDCREKGTTNIFSSVDKSKIDEEYMSLMAELGEGPPPPTKTGGHSNSHSGFHSSPLSGPQGPMRSIMPPPVQQTTMAMMSPPWASSNQSKPQTMMNAISTSQQVQPPIGVPPPPGTVAQSSMLPWQQTTAQIQQPTIGVTITQPTIGLQNLPPPPSLLQPPPPPPPMASQAQPSTCSTAMPWFTIPQPVITQGTAMLPWQTAPAQTVTTALPVPPVTAYPAWANFLGAPPPPPVQPPMPPSSVTSNSTGVDLSHVGLPNLLAQPPPPPPPS